MEVPNHTCPNPTCGKTFTKPLKVKNLSSGAPTVYEACPYCLTEIAIEGIVYPIKQKPMAAGEETVKLEPKKGHEEIAAVFHQQPSVEASKCKHYFGYLSERSSRDAPPEECMVCPKIVQCMLKGITE